LSEYHTGYRAFSRNVLESINFNLNSDDFVFDNQMLSQIIYFGFPVAEITCPTRYFKGASSINLWRSTVYALGVIRTSFEHLFNKLGLIRLARYK
jgi:hypothetical protein